MARIVSSLILAIRQLTGPTVIRILAKSLVITLGVFAIIAAALWGMIDWAIDTGAEATLPSDYSGTVAGILAVSIGLIAGWFLFRVVALAVLQFFADEIVAAIEQLHYPDQACSARKLPFRQDLANSLRGIGRALLFNLLALPVAVVLIFTAIGPAIVFWLVNAVLLGRELTDMAWQRHCGDAPQGNPVSAFDRFILGGIIAALMAVPFIGLLAPIIGAAAGTHITHKVLADRRPSEVLHA